MSVATVEFYKNLAERRIFRFVFAYCAGGWALLEVINQLVQNDVLPGFLYRAALALVISGFPGALIVSWFHGAKGRQEMPPVERWLLSGVAVFAIVSTGLVVRAELSSAEDVPGARELTATDDPRRVAVLYFEPRGGEDAAFLASGLTETLIDQLSEVQGLHVVSRNASRLFQGSNASPDSIGRALQVGSLVGGTVSQAGDRVRIDVSLTSASSGEQFASRRLERPRAEIFDLQDELGDSVAVFLRREIGQELGARTGRLATESVEAWELVQRGARAEAGANVLVGSDDIEAASRSLSLADSLFAEAEDADPRWIDPVVRRGWVAYRQSRLGGLDRAHYETWIGRGLEHASRALEREPRNPDALELQATLRYWRFLLNLAGTPAEADELFHQAEDGLRAAIAAAGGSLPSAQNSLSHLLQNKGQVAEAKLNAQEAYLSDPFLENVNLTLWRIFTSAWGLQDTVEARRYCQEGVRRFPDDFRFQECQLWLFALPGVEPEPERAWALKEEFVRLSPPQMRELNRRHGYMYVSLALARASLPDSARAVAQRGRAGPDLDPVRNLARWESITLAWLGDTEEAVRQLTLYLAANPGQMAAYRTAAVRRDLPWYHQGLLEEPRFFALVGAQ
jgi:TolB-like protein